MSPDPEDAIPIPLENLTPRALQGIVEECVTRDGTENTDAAKKVAQVMSLLESGAAEVWFNSKTKTCSIVAVERY